MRNRNRSLAVFCCISLAVAFLLSWSLGQTGYRPRGGVAPGFEQATPETSSSGSNEIRIRKFTGIGSRSIATTPMYRTSYPETSTKAEEWVIIETAYETAPEWMDDLGFEYFALTERIENGVKLYSLFKRIVRYTDVDRGRHLSTVFLRPTAVKRWGRLVAVAVEVSVGGKVVAQETDMDRDMQKITLFAPPARWWRDPNIVESKITTIRHGYLLDRASSPFALINIDDYETIKP